MYIKLLFCLAVLAAALLGGAIPLLGRTSARAGRLLGWGNGFAAGVFLGAGLIHLLPDALAAGAQLGWDAPRISEIAVLAFLGILLIEHVLLPVRAHDIVHEHASERMLPAGGLTPYTVLAALSVHSLLTGLALGAEPELHRALVIFFAILAHKSTAGFALGVSLVRGAIPSTRSWRLLVFFAVTTPLGILAGASLHEMLSGHTQQALDATFLALAAGTFVYVATMDILREEFAEPQDRFGKWLSVVLGVGTMALLAVWM